MFSALRLSLTTASKSHTGFQREHIHKFYFFSNFHSLLCSYHLFYSFVGNKHPIFSATYKTAGDYEWVSVYSEIDSLDSPHTSTGFWKRCSGRNKNGRCRLQTIKGFLCSNGCWGIAYSWVHFAVHECMYPRWLHMLTFEILRKRALLRDSYISQSASPPNSLWFVLFFFHSLILVLV